MNYRHSSIDKTLAKLTRWYHQPLGRALWQCEKMQITQALSRVFGYHLVQLGGANDTCLIDKSPISHRVRLSSEQSGRYPGPSICGDFYELPLARDSVDVMVLPHLLEFLQYPQRVLEEVVRVLVPEGRLVIVGFNPFSVWGACRLVGQLDEILLHATFHGVRKVKCWVAALGLDIELCKTDFFRFPINQGNLLVQTAFLEAVGQLGWARGGAVYIIMAKKRVETVTPIRPSWAKCWFRGLDRPEGVASLSGSKNSYERECYWGSV